MRLLFCADSLNRRLPDSMYDAEVEAAKDLALPYELLDFEALTYEMNAEKAVRWVTSSQTPELAVYRGWMLPLVRYKELFRGSCRTWNFAGQFSRRLPSLPLPA